MPLGSTLLWLRNPYAYLDRALAEGRITFRASLPMMGDCLITGDPDLVCEIEQNRDLIGGHRALRIRRVMLVALRLRRCAVAAQIRGDHGEVAREHVGAFVPDFVCLRMTVQEQKRRTVAALDPGNADARLRGFDAKRLVVSERHDVFLFVALPEIVGAASP